MTIYGAVPRGGYRQMARGNPRSLGFERYALDFNGVNNYVDCGITPSLQITGAFTIEALVDYTGPAGLFIGIVDQSRGNPALGGISFIIGDAANKKVDLYLADGGGPSPKFRVGDLPVGKVHLVGTWDGTVIAGSMKIYFNEVSQPGGEADYGTIPALPTRSLRIGFSVSYFKGLIAFVRIYKDYALNQEEVKWNRLNYHNPVRPDKLVLWLPMEEGAGLVAADHSGLGNNGALLPVATPPTWEQVRQYELRAQTE